MQASECYKLFEDVLLLHSTALRLVESEMSSTTTTPTTTTTTTTTTAAAATTTTTTTAAAAAVAHPDSTETSSRSLAKKSEEDSSISMNVSIDESMSDYGIMSMSDYGIMSMTELRKRRLFHLDQMTKVRYDLFYFAAPKGV